MEPIQAYFDHIPDELVAALALFLLLAAPRLVMRIKLPGLVGLLGAGILLGPSVLGLVPADDEVVEWLGELGKLLLMFYAALEVDLDRFMATRNHSFTFGALSFAVPLLGGALVAFAFGYPWLGAVLIGSLLASHTLLGYPIVRRVHVVRNEAVTAVIGGTIVTDTAALLVLAICVSIHAGGFSPLAIGLQLVALAIYIPVILLGVGWLTRWLIEHLGGDVRSAILILLLVVFIGAASAELIGLEGIIGAFLVGLAVNRVVSGTPVKERVEFFGNIMFVPMFFLAMGVQLDLAAFAQSLVTDLPFVAAILAILFATKWLAAAATGRLFGYSRGQTLTMWSLSLPQVAATLAAAMVAHGTLNSEGEPLIDALALNAIIVVMVVTSIAGPILTERFATRLPDADPSQAPTPTTEAFE
jgi:Kef-type K+ transport system membrane component KefB